ncbi:polysaccharide deacetylase family protein [Sulfurimonas microaerophilic]|uniref:polysaccharide deacetylase family protein n=1 Tax=Sulfurimonas microaerophilic TaxID=3058392 RepID=UPI0027153D5D|nr:hypothetical protein [Sulfurimonas sp. hsl 1-7]
MKHLCYSKIILTFFLFIATAYGSVNDKSAIVYLGKDISYPMVGIHDYIIVDPVKTNVYTHGFEVYNNKIYAKVNISNSSTIQELLDHVTRLSKSGYKNFFFDVQKPIYQKNLTLFLNKFRSTKTVQDAQVIIHLDDQELLSSISKYIDTLLVYNASKDPKLENNIKFYKNLSDDIIDVEILSSNNIEQLKHLGFIPYITTPSMDNYGKSSKNAIKREILTLVNESIEDRKELSASRYGALPLEYNGYIQKLYNIQNSLPDPEHMGQYAGVVIWLSIGYKDSVKLVTWIKEIQSQNIPVVFAYDFGFNSSNTFLQQLGISAMDAKADATKTIVHKDKMMDYEIKVPLNQDRFYIKPPAGSKALLTYKDNYGLTSTPAAITPWGGYALGDSFFIELDGENLWSIDPFMFFKEALRLKDLPVPDTTTENGSRLFFTHMDGDGILNGVEFNPEFISGDIIYSEILKKYKFPHSVSLIGAEIMPDGLYPKESKRLLQLSKKIYALDNVEPATHTFTHPFFWGKIKDDQLDEKYRLQAPGYTFSTAYETLGMLDFIQDKLIGKNSDKKANLVFWSGDCNPRTDALEYLAKHNILNINGGDTTINNANPWLTRVAPLGLERDGYYQIYTGAENENVFTKDWMGPYWGFKKVVQTFELTNSPKRLKPIDVYYHFYSASKKASLNAVRYVFDWVMQQKDIMPIYTSQYIPKAMDFWTASIAYEEGVWLYDGMRDLKTLRVEKKDATVALNDSQTILGVKHFENHTYIALDPHIKHSFKLNGAAVDNTAYLISSNGEVTEYINNKNSKRYKFNANVPLEIKLHIPNNCVVNAIPESSVEKLENKETILKYKSNKKATIDVRCQ